MSLQQWLPMFTMIVKHTLQRNPYIKAIKKQDGKKCYGEFEKMRSSAD